MIKKIFRFLLFLLLVLVLFFGAVFIFPKIEPKQTLGISKIMPVRQLDSLYWAMQIETLRKEFGNRKTLVPGYELQTLLALRYFPELKDVRVNFVYKKAVIPLSSRPNLFTMFGNRKNWEFRVIVSNKSLDSMEPILLKNLPFDAQVAILAHELGHTKHYQKYGFWQLLKFGLMYAINSEFRAIHERSTDETVIYQGLGWQLFEYAKFVRTDPTTIKGYEASKDFLDKNYMTPADIMEVMTHINTYGLAAPF
ncbi:MAG: hypothetical protein SFU99_15845 [Saprospiraceae bacterium]|nr:hypothetical protein [Saprospiraceae bacterium]